MRVILEFDGVIADVMPGYFAAHRDAAQSVGWSRLDEPTFRRLTRTRGSEAELLPGAKPAKMASYRVAWDRLVEADAAVSSLKPQAGLPEFVRQLRRFGSLIVVTVRPNIEARRHWLDRQGGLDAISCFERLSDDPRRRPVELKVLAANDDRTIVVGSSDTLVRSADAGELFVIGLSTGDCSVKRLTQAGARLVYAAPEQLSNSLQTGGADLVRAGMLPLTVG